MGKEKQNAISPTREQDYPEWYQQVIKAADLAEASVVRGCMVIKPWGFGIWEKIQEIFDKSIKATGHENAYFPLFVPLSFLEKEAEHVEGFAKECAVVTHHRLEEKDGRLVPAGKLEEPYIVRPTSETIIGESFSRWIKSYRDLPLLINQWANVVRWEMRTRLFLRTAEFLWQEGHTAHASEKEAKTEVELAANMYKRLMEDYLAIPVIVGEKPEGERFPGADITVALEAMMQDKKALQMGTSHYLGQNFAKAQNIRFLDQSGELQYAYTTSWGVSTRMIGGLIMTHSDDDGLRVPPRISPKHIVILPVTPKPETQQQIFESADSLCSELCALSYVGNPLAAFVDRRDIRGGEKNWQWVKKGIPIRIEIGPKDITSNSVVVYRRDKDVRDKLVVKREDLAELIIKLLDEIHLSYFKQAKEFQAKHTVYDLQNYEEFKQFFTPKNQDKPEIHGGFVLAKWCNKQSCAEAQLTPLKVSIRCLPREQRSTSGHCVLCGAPANVDALFAKAY